MKVGVIVFPGSNCDHDTYRAFKLVPDIEVVYLWHASHELQGSDLVVLPGGFSYGDYLRAGAIARFAPIMKRVSEFANGGGLVLGICNGFQMLLEAGLLPGAMLRNRDLRFVCKWITLRTESYKAPLTAKIAPGTLLRMPVAHGEGNYFADMATLRHIDRSGQVLFRYSDEHGVIAANANPNGSSDGIAGICNKEGNVMGMMPHPERASEPILGSTDGLALIKSICTATIGGMVAR